VDDLGPGESLSPHDASWQTAKSGLAVAKEALWFRRWIEVPQKLHGYDLTGAPGYYAMKTALSHNISEAAAMLESLAELETQVNDAVRLIAGAFNGGHKLLACGNGGSAAEAAHLTTEFVCRFDRDRRPYPAICLSAHAGDLTAIGNDYAFDDIFARQLEAFAQTGDVLGIKLKRK
jgi:SIS domain